MSATVDGSLPENYTLVCNRDALPARGKKHFSIDQHTVLIVTCDGDVFAIEDRCPLTGGSIANGRVLNGVITAPSTGAHYDLSTGRYVGGGQFTPESNWLAVYPVRLVGDRVYVHLPQS